MRGVKPSSNKDGVKLEQVRDRCETCGGNTTEYDRHHPHPESPRGQLQALAVRRAKRNV